MPTRPLPNDPSLEHLRKQAKRLRNAVRAGDAVARALVEEFHPRADRSSARFPLAGAQLVLARSYGFASWTKLAHHLTAIGPFVWNPPPVPPASQVSDADLFIRLACLIYGNWDRSNPARAAAKLAENPEIATTSVFAASAAGDVPAVLAMIQGDPALVNAKGGPYRWEPLLYACYSRMDAVDANYSTLDVARVLLAHGADANAGFLWGATYPLTALTGAFGEGEDAINQIPHPDAIALATLLLDAGADPNDSQALYNRHFKESDEHLRLLLPYGLGRGSGGPWRQRLGDRAVTPAGLLTEELWAAAKNGRPQRVRLLVAHGVDVNTPGVRNGRTPYEEALRHGNDAIATYLLEHGARKINFDPIEAFAVACIAGRRDEVRSRLEQDPDLLQRLGHAGHVDLLHRAYDAGQRDGLRLIVELGVDINGFVPNSGLDRTVLHDAAGAGDVEMIRYLLALGADPHLRDPTYHATAIGWAVHGDRRDAIACLLPSASIFDAVQADGVERVTELLRQDPSLPEARDDNGRAVVFYLHAEMRRLPDMVRLLVASGADLNARDASGQTLVDRALAHGWTDFASTVRAQGGRAASELVAAPSVPER